MVVPMNVSALLRRARGSATAPLAAAALLVVAAAATAQTAAPSAPRLEPLEGPYVATTRTNVRQQPSAQSARVGQIESGATVRVTGKVAGAPWYAVMQENGVSGFVSADLLRAVPVPADPAPAPAPVQPPAPAPAQPPAPAPAPAVAPAAPAPEATPAPPAAPAAAAAADPALKEQLTKIESALADINRQMPSAKELENLSAAVKGLLEREQKRATDEAAAASAPKAPAPAPEPEGPSMAERMAKLQDQIAQQIAEQKAEFGRLGDRMQSVETSVQPMIDWAKDWTSKAGPAADSAQSWFYSTYLTVRDWLLGWIPWWTAAPPPPAKPSPNPPPRT